MASRDEEIRRSLEAAWLPGEDHSALRCWRNHEGVATGVMLVDDALRIGNVELDGAGGSPHRARPADEDLIPMAVFRGLVVICTVRIEMYEQGSDDLDGIVERLKYELPTDARYRRAYDQWWHEFRQIPKADRWLVQSRQLSPHAQEE
jgi:hypothetical protein